MDSHAHEFKLRAREALCDSDLQSALAHAKLGFVDKRRQAIQDLPESQALRDRAVTIKDHTLAHLDFYLERYERQVLASGGQVHWARTGAEAREIVLDICRQARAQRIAKGKSMAGEEVGLNQALETAGLDVVETDLGEYILQLAREAPSHIIAPAMHKTRAEIARLFHAHHARHHLDALVTEVPELVDQARQILREQFLGAEVGITGANFLVAETGSSVLVTNEGNGDLTCTLPPVHIVTAGIEKVVPTLEDATTLLRLLARSATGQDMSAYTTFTTGPKRGADLDGPREYHVVLIDNGRTELLGNDLHEILRCIRCGACLNHCPVYNAVGGHAYGSVYPGPMGSVLTPALAGLERTGDLPNACTMNGRCEAVCPVRIPLPKLLRNLRTRQHAERLTSTTQRSGLKLWAYFAHRPRLYAHATHMAVRVLSALAGKRGRLKRLALAGGWTSCRDLPAPRAETFQRAWQRRGRDG